MGTELIFSENEHFSRPPEGGEIMAVFRIEKTRDYTVMAIALLGVAVLLTCSLQNGIILLVMAFLISPFGLPMAAIWLLGKVQDLKFAIQDLVYG